MRARWAIDPWLLATLAALAVLGMATLYAAVHGGDVGLWRRQGIYWAVGLVVCAAVAAIPLRVWAYVAWPAYAMSLLLLALVPVVGEVRMGARRWIDLGLFSVQPSEAMKWALVLALAHLLAAREPRDARTLLAAVALIGLPAGLIAAEPDLGTALVLGATGTAMLVAAGLPWRWLGAAALGVVLAAPVAWRFLLHDYQRQRVRTFLDPEADPLGAGYHVIQSKIAIGSGGLFGKGWLQGSQARLHFLPEQHTDFIFAVLAEEGGLFAAGTLLALYGLLLFRMLAIAGRAGTRFGALIVVGVASVFLLYLVVNIGMVSGMLPVVGVPLPFVSYGGSALLTLLAALGLVMRVSIESRHRIPWQRPGSPFAD